MKKRLLILGMIFTMAVSSAGCGSSSSSDNAGRTDKQTATVHDKYKSADEITMDDLMSHGETPAEDFELIDNSDEIVIEKYVGKDPIVVIPDEIDGKKVVDFDKTFWNNKIVVAIRVGNNVTEIKKTAFVNCESLKYVVLGESVKSLGSNSFVNTNIKEIELNDGLQKIGEDDTNNTVDAPDSNYGMDLKIPDSVTEIHVRDFNLIVKSGSQAEQYAKDFADSNNLTYTVE